MIADKAKRYFLGKEGKRMNCAQAVVAAAGSVFELPESAVEIHGRSAAGRAPGGYCGGLYAALYVLELVDKERMRECEDFFKACAGALTCKEIRAAKKLDCVECVGKAAEFLEKIKTHGGV